MTILLGWSILQSQHFSSQSLLISETTACVQIVSLSSNNFLYSATKMSFTWSWFHVNVVYMKREWNVNKRAYTYIDLLLTPCCNSLCNLFTCFKRLFLNFYFQTSIFKLLFSNFYFQTSIFKLLFSNFYFQTFISKLLFSNFYFQTFFKIFAHAMVNIVYTSYTNSRISWRYYINYIDYFLGKNIIMQCRHAP